MCVCPGLVKYQKLWKLLIYSFTSSSHACGCDINECEWRSQGELTDALVGGARCTTWQPSWWEVAACGPQCTPGFLNLGTVNILDWEFFFLFFLAKISSFIKRGVSFQTAGCVYVPKLCAAFRKPLHCCVFLACCHVSIDRHSVPGETLLQLCTFKAPSLLLFQGSMFRNKKPTLGAKHHTPSAW